MKLELGCAENYEVFLTARDLTTNVTELPFSEVNYSRVLDEVSDATVTVPDVFGGLRCNLEVTSAVQSWLYGIRIERDGQSVWRGPITSVQRPLKTGALGGDDYVTIGAHDKMAWTRKRTPFGYQNYQGVDAGVVFQGVITDAMAPDNVPGLVCPSFETGYTMTREVLPRDFEYVHDICIELANSAVDFFVVDDKLVVEDGFTGWFYQDADHGKTRIAVTDDPYGRYLFGIFTDEAFTARPGWTEDGFARGNTVYVPGADSGEAGFRRFWTAADVDTDVGILEYVDVSPLYRATSDGPVISDEVFQQRADSLLALRGGPVITVQGGILSEEAPVTMDYLLPGSVWGIDLADEGIAQLLTAQRLKRVDVSVSMGEGGAMVERVEPTLIPLGTDESEGG